MSRVLVIEQNPDNRRLLIDVLRSGGFAASAVDTAGPVLAEAVGAEAVLLDVTSLGRQDAGELHRLLRADARTARLPVLAVGRDAADWDLGMEPAAGATYYLAQPFTAAALLSRLRHLIVHAALADAALAGLTGPGRHPPAPAAEPAQSPGRTTTFSPVRAAAAANADPVSASG